MMRVSSMVKEPKYLSLSDEEVAKETERRLKEMKQLLSEIRDLLKSAGGIE
jgi:large-conductance mechanosensitive channel